MCVGQDMCEHRFARVRTVSVPDGGIKRKEGARVRLGAGAAAVLVRAT